MTKTARAARAVPVARPGSYAQGAVTRRRFLKSGAVFGAALGFPYFVPGRVLGAQGATPPSEKIVMGCIGVGSMGGGHLRAILGGVVRGGGHLDLQK